MNSEPQKTSQPPDPEKSPAEVDSLSFYKVQFRPEGQIVTVNSRINNLRIGEAVMIQTDHGLEPGLIKEIGPAKWPENSPQHTRSQVVSRRCTRDETVKFERLEGMEQKAFATCIEQIKKLNLPMQLVRVERFFNGSKIIFYFTAENRVDFRELVKTLVQEFRTRVEMRQIGVRHETKMIGGMGCCGRELCCSSFIKKFESVSIKMAKAQNLPLNPAKISGACNRLLCCLDYEFKAYKSIRKNMPKVGKRITLDNETFKVCRHNVLQETVVVVNNDGEESILDKEKWQKAKMVPPPKNNPKQ